MSNDASTARAGRKVNINFQALGIFIAAAVIFIIFGILNPNFLTLDNLRDVAVSACVNALIGIGLTFVIITGGIDLSVGSIASLVGMVSANIMVNSGVAPIPGLLAGIVVGFSAGVVNGLLITLLKLPPFIATLGTMSVYQGLAYVVTNGTPVYNVPQQFVLMLNSYIGGVPVIVIIVIVVAILAALLLRRTVFGQNVIAIGGSEETAWLSGVRVNRVKILVYGISGGLAALAGLVLVARISAAQSEAGSPYLLTAIAAAVIGGANLMGGEGRITGTLVGALILGALTNGLVLLNVPSFYEQIVTGLVVIIAVAVDQGSKGWPMLKRGGRGGRDKPVPAPLTSSVTAADIGAGTTAPSDRASDADLPLGSGASK
ncbi:ABC transporter permease [Rathayibacter sp. YIM 133350]|uniref:ABC transporter permease n=1 Tax=Rathayibacter sp. YIM 133350 TaxID=3131992 RepID=UPI00307F685B